MKTKNGGILSLTTLNDNKIPLAVPAVMIDQPFERALEAQGQIPGQLSMMIFRIPKNQHVANLYFNTRRGWNNNFGCC